MMRSLLAYPLTGLLLLILSPTALSHPAANARKFFAPILPLLTQTKAPILLPTYIPQLHESQLYPVLEEDSFLSANGGYGIVISGAPGCTAHACEYGTIEAEKITTSTPTIAQEVASYRELISNPHVSHAQDTSGPITLTNGIKAYFIPSTCGANCSDASVVWDQEGYRYRFGLRSGAKQDVIDMANSIVRVRMR